MKVVKTATTKSISNEDLALHMQLAVETGTTESSPAPIAATAVSAMRLRSVVLDICFLSLVRIRNFLNLARRSFDLLIPFPCGTHV